MSEPTEGKRSDERVLGDLLGPGVPELSCEECFAALDRYVELAVAEEDADDRVPGMRAHLAGCPACAEEFRSLSELVRNDEDLG